MKKVGFIGAGNMAGAIISGIINDVSCKDIAIYDISENVKKKYEIMGCTVVNSVRELCDFSDVIFLSVKPQHFDLVMPEIPAHSNKIFVSIAAGVTIDYIKSFLGAYAKVFRIMPNMPLMFGCGASAVSCSENVSQSDREYVFNIFSRLGCAVFIDEVYMNTVVSVNGSSPAYLYLFAKAVSDYAFEKGLPRIDAEKLFAQTLIGAGTMLLKSGKSINELIDEVSSKGGTTEQAMASLYNNDFENIVKKAMTACENRSIELQK